MKVFNKEFSKISEAAVVLAFFTLLSQFLGIFRDRFLAGNVGTGELLDVYYAAFRVPDLLFTLGASLVSVSILMPYFSKKLSESKDQAKNFVNAIFTTFFLFIVLVSLLAYVTMPFLVKKFFPGFETDLLDQTIMLSRIMLLSPIILGISNLFATITQAFKKFFVYALAPVFYNLGIIIGIVLFYPFWGISGLAYGVILGAILHLLIQAPVVFKSGFLPRFTKSVIWDDMREVVKHSLPRTVTLSLSKIVFLFFVSVASTLLPGTISVFNLSYNLQSVPLAIIGVSYSVAAFPVLVEFFNSKETEKFMAHVMGPIRQIVFWSLPIISLFIVLRAQIVRTILGTGSFDWSDTRLTAASLALFIISVVAQSIILLLVRAYYAAGKTWRPLWITITASAITVACAYIFVDIFDNYSFVQNFFEKLLRIEGVPGSSVIMLSLAYSVGMFINLFFLWQSFKRDFSYQSGKYGIIKSLWQSFTASILIGVSAYFFLNISDSWFNSEATLGVFSHGLFAGIFSVFVGVLYLRSIKNQEISVFIKTLKRKIFKKKIFGNIHRNI